MEELINKKNFTIIKKIILIFFSLTLALVIAEGSLRVYKITSALSKGRRIAKLSDNRVLGYELKPNYKFRRFNINNYGFKGKDIDIKKGKDIFRIIVLGDSITFAPGLNEKDTYAFLLERYLNKSDMNRHFEVINAGVGGYNIWQNLEVYKSKAKPLSPDLVIVGVCQNDFEVTGPYYVDFFGMVHGDVPEETQEGLLNNLEIYRTVSRRIKMYNMIREKGPDAIKPIAPTLSSKWINGSVPLKEFVKITKADNIPILFVIFPYEFQIKGNDLHSDEKFTEFMKDSSIFYIDLLDNFRNANKELYAKGDSIHPNELGHMITADTIYRFLVGNGIITADAGRPTPR